MVTRAERKALEKDGWRSTGDLAFSIARDLRINAGTLSMRIPRILSELLAQKGKSYENAHVRRRGERLTFVDETCVADIRAAVARSHRRVGDPLPKADLG